MKTRFVPFLILMGASALWARHGECRSAPGCACALPPASKAALSLSAPEAKALSFQIDEERMAGEIYRTLGKQWSLRPFINIPRAEDRHQALLVSLATRAGLPPVGETTPGKFQTPEVQARYDALVKRGEVSLLEALQVGALIEEQDIADLRAMVHSTGSADLKSAATVLEAGSRNHLRAFVRNLCARGVEYEPRILSAEEYVEIVTLRR
ncbi:MAG: DUF2202 domain-containing protein [Cephaloticoccus sp.]|nr:DUF2202 domain-containing protein [Cephaloticoccus sp.]MCF7761870.1 DUF2202 domain-containing protein [Cephaloticoccus sp.]